MSQAPATLRLFSGLLGMIAGLGVYLIMTNRLLSYLDGTFKLVFLSAAFVGIVGGLSLFGYASAPSIRTLIPALVILGIGLGELRRLLIRRRCRGAPPVYRSGPHISLLHPVTTTDLCALHYQVGIPGWQGPQFRIAHLSDFHVNDRVPADYYLGAMERASRAQPDLVFITGDFLTELRFAHLLPDILRAARSRLGVFAILGNHDYWADPERVAEIVRAQGIQLLRDGWQRLQVGERGRLLILGCEQPWSGGKTVLPPVREGELALALAHTADNVYRLSQAGVAAVFSGHYHAGQLQIPGFGPVILPSAYGRRFDHGHFLVNGTHLFVSAGIGAAKPPFRIYCQPDYFIVDFKGNEGQTQ